MSDLIYENMASVSVSRSYAKSVLGTKILTLPTQDNGWLPAPPTELCNYYDNIIGDELLLNTPYSQMADTREKTGA